MREHRRTRWWLLVAVLAAVVVVVVVLVLNRIGGEDAFTFVDDASGDWAYLAVFLLVLADAVCPVFPGETTLNAAATLAAQGKLALGVVMVAGALGAIAGDSALYWIARRCGRRFQPRIQAATENPKVAAALELLGTRASLLLVAGRYVPGVRFVVNASLGLSDYPYRRFLLWSSIGGITWSVYTCGLAYLVGTALAGFPLASVVISGLITTVALAAIFLVVRRSRHTPA